MLRGRLKFEPNLVFGLTNHLPASSHEISNDWNLHKHSSLYAFRVRWLTKWKYKFITSNVLIVAHFVTNDFVLK
jgi:hypothetical protein